MSYCVHDTTTPPPPFPLPQAFPVDFVVVIRALQTEPFSQSVLEAQEIF